MKWTAHAAGLGVLAALAVCTLALAAGRDFSAWSPAIARRSRNRHRSVVQRSGPGRLSVHLARREEFYMASDRPGGLGGLDIWVSSASASTIHGGHRQMSVLRSIRPRTTSARRSPADGHLFYFVSNRPGGCGGADIYTTRLRSASGFEASRTLAVS